MKGQQLNIEERGNRKARLHTFEKEGLFCVRNFGIWQKWMPGTMVKRLGAVNYEVLLGETGTLVHRHVDHLLKRASEHVMDAPEVDAECSEINESTS